MTNAELNNYILHYVKADRTKSAIMLTAGWGTGKSHYIQNELIPFLEKDENGKYSCIVISLYGLKNVDEISKCLYLESRMGFLAKGSERVATGKFAVKTVVKGVTSFFGIDLSKSEEELRELYKSVDLSGKLIVLEDVERTSIDILTILGYVNGLVEQDGVKVLLVANEEEILNYRESEPDKNGKTYKIPDERTLAYLRTKEKTVSDTIVYHGDLEGALCSIISQYDNKWLNKFSEEDSLDVVTSLMMMRQNYNLRSFIFACQKIVDIFDKIDTHEDYFIKTIFFSIVSFSMIIKYGSYPTWDGTDLVSTKLGVGDYPLYRFCYDYIRWQEFDTKRVADTIEAHKKLRLYDRQAATNNDCDLSVLFDCYNHYENDVRNALKNVEERLASAENIPFYSYSKLAYFLVSCHSILGFDYSLCEERMISNLRNNRETLDLEILFFNHFEFENDAEKVEFDEFLNALKEAINYSSSTLDFSYLPDELYSFYTFVAKNSDQVTSGHAFISKFNMDKLLNMIFICSPAQLNDLRGILFAIYRHAKKDSFLEKDVEFMKELVSEINGTLSEKSASIDRFVLQQIYFLIDNLQTFVNQLS